VAAAKDAGRNRAFILRRRDESAIARNAAVKANGVNALRQALDGDWLRLYVKLCLWQTAGMPPS